MFSINSKFSGVEKGVNRILADLHPLCGGERGIRTPGTVARSPHFECGPFDHSGISPCGLGVDYRVQKYNVRSK